ncbi:MAG: hypothetical protein ACMUIG_05130 [Thermoplasmatota archaeon]
MSIRTRCVRRHIEEVLLSPGGVRFTPRSFSISHAEAEDEISPFAPPEGGVIIRPVIHNPMDRFDLPAGLPGKLPVDLDDPVGEIGQWDLPREFLCLQPPAGMGIGVILLSRG